MSWLQGTCVDGEGPSGLGWLPVLRGEGVCGTTLTAGNRHYAKGVRADDWSWQAMWDGLGDARGTSFVEIRQSVWERSGDPAGLLASVLATVRASRVDIAADQVDGDRPAALFLRRDAAWTRTRRGSWTLIQRGDGGETLSIGSRTSERFLRVYVKGEGLIRHELELKHDLARAAAGSLLGGGRPADVFAAEYGRIVRWPVAA